MSYDKPNYYVNVNSQCNAENYYSNNAQNSYPVQPGTSHRDVSFSTLEPTAQEFHPSNQHTNSNVNNGAIKKRPQNGKNRNGDNMGSRNVRYGTGRTFNSSQPKGNRNISTAERNRLLQETADFLRNTSYTERDVSFGEGAFSTNSTNERTLQESENYSERYSGEQRHSNRGANHNKKFEVSNAEQGNETENFNYQDVNSQKNYKGRNDKSLRNKFQGRSDRNYSYEKYDRYNDQFDRNSRTNYYEKSDKNGSNEKRNSYYERTYSRGYENEDFDNTSTDQYPSYNKDNRNNKYSGRTEKNWRKKAVNKENSLSYVNRLKSNKKIDAASQKERLEEMLNRRVLECLVCCEKIKHADKVWSCAQCYHILHLSCVSAWAKSSKIENGWRCPACQNVCSEVPVQYYCYCGKASDPKYNPNIVPHGCGEMCLRKGRGCEHKCTILCHPGPCPDCQVMVSKSCGCGATQQLVKCSADLKIICNAVCDKLLGCGVHRCLATCHAGECDPCTETIVQECFCGKVGRKVLCTAEFNGSTRYACENVCEKKLSCGNHKCLKQCHDGPCDTCERDVNNVISCPCGKTCLEEARMSCLDPIPCCDKVCGRSLNCGQPSSPHKCKELCHEGPCPPCSLITTVRCRCGHMDKEIPCAELTTKADDARCEKKCTKKRLCRKHKCNQKCCIEIEHFCPLPCNHQLSCGKHRCERTCHSGRCPPCMETSFEELYCECGSSVRYPPVPCGTKPPICNKPCSRSRPCGHEANHSCHTGPCPPCTVLCKRWCHGRHEQRSAIPCHQEKFSCGMACGKSMPCGRHKCDKVCHEGPCPLPCKQPCAEPRSCGHPCNKPCHDSPCPETNCRQNMVVTCPCGLQKSTRPCLEVTEEFRNMQMARKMADLAKEQSVDISDLVVKPNKAAVLKILDCNDECRILERNRRLAIGLQIRNPDLSQKLTPRYTDYLRQWAKKDPHFCQRIHDKLTELVQLAKQSKQKSRSHSFESMNRDKRHFIHEYCEHFGVESAAYDMEPNRNVIATAIKEKSWLPGMSLLEVIQRENGQRKVPGPVSVLSRSSTSKSETVSLMLPSSGQILRSSTYPSEVTDSLVPSQ